MPLSAIPDCNMKNMVGGSADRLVDRLDSLAKSWGDQGHALF